MNKAQKLLEFTAGSIVPSPPPRAGSDEFNTDSEWEKYLAAQYPTIIDKRGKMRNEELLFEFVAAARVPEADKMARALSRTILRKVRVKPRGGSIGQAKAISIVASDPNKSNIVHIMFLRKTQQLVFINMKAESVSKFSRGLQTIIMNAPEGYQMVANPRELRSNFTDPEWLALRHAAKTSAASWGSTADWNRASREIKKYTKEVATPEQDPTADAPAIGPAGDPGYEKERARQRAEQEQDRRDREDFEREQRRAAGYRGRGEGPRQRQEPEYEEPVQDFEEPEDDTKYYGSTDTSSSDYYSAPNPKYADAIDADFEEIPDDESDRRYKPDYDPRSSRAKRVRDDVNDFRGTKRQSRRGEYEEPHPHDRERPDFDQDTIDDDADYLQQLRGRNPVTGRAYRFNEQHPAVKHIAREMRVLGTVKSYPASSEGHKLQTTSLHVRLRRETGGKGMPPKGTLYVDGVFGNNSEAERAIDVVVDMMFPNRSGAERWSNNLGSLVKSMDDRYPSLIPYLAQKLAAKWGSFKGNTVFGRHRIKGMVDDMAQGRSRYRPQDDVDIHDVPRDRDSESDLNDITMSDFVEAIDALGRSVKGQFRIDYDENDSGAYTGSVQRNMGDPNRRVNNAVKANLKFGIDIDNKRMLVYDIFGPADSRASNFIIAVLRSFLNIVDDSWQIGIDWKLRGGSNPNRQRVVKEAVQQVADEYGSYNINVTG